MNPETPLLRAIRLAMAPIFKLDVDPCIALAGYDSELASRVGLC